MSIVKTYSKLNNAFKLYDFSKSSKLNVIEIYMLS